VIGVERAERGRRRPPGAAPKSSGPGEAPPPSAADFRREWLEADGLGGFASGTVAGPRTRRYHALLLSATEPPAGRVVLVSGLEAWVETESGSFAITAQAYAPDVLHPRGDQTIESFTPEPWPTWVHRLPDGTRLRLELLARHGVPALLLRWTLLEGRGAATLRARPLLSGRDFHALQRENDAFRFDAEVSGEVVAWHPYPGLPPIRALSNGVYDQAPDWYRNFLAAEEEERGLDHVEDLASPGTFRFDVVAGPALLVLATDVAGAPGPDGSERVSELASSWIRAEARRRKPVTPIERAADAYLVRRGAGLSIIAGYPWFGDWGRDTFIALRGLCLATGRHADAARILAEWAGAVSLGMMPNRFPDRGEAPEYNSVDASLWYVIAVHELLEADGAGVVRRRDRDAMLGAVHAILGGYSAGTRHGIRADTDGLLACGEPGVQLTWMDAKVGDWVVTPRIGKPVEVQALWINALAVGARHDARWAGPLERARSAFARRFWNEARGALHDVVDVDHVPGTVDPTCRPNQLFAVGGLPFPLLDGARARGVVDDAERHLWTPIGLRSLAPFEAGYAGAYRGGVLERDGAYHRGTVWPWLLGAFVEAWVRARGGGAAAKVEARERFLAPLYAHLSAAGIGHVSEIADGDAPHAPRGCPFQAWSTGELLRLDRVVLR
jgi:predicted glycogen debranching enzyme